MTDLDPNQLVRMNFSLTLTLAESIAFEAFLDYWERIQRAGLNDPFLIALEMHSEERDMNLHFRYENTEEIAILPQKSDLLESAKTMPLSSTPPVCFCSWVVRSHIRRNQQKDSSCD